MYILESGLRALVEYLSGHVLTCLVPAFFIAGGIASFVSQAGIIKYFGAGARRVVAYSVASVSGAILAVCSKNNEADALEALDEHPEMLLRSKDFATLKINWTDKAQNLREIAAELNIGIDSLE